MDEQRVVFSIEVPSTELASEACLDGCGEQISIRYSYEMNGSLINAKIRFFRVQAVRTRCEPCCKPWHIEAYDVLTEVENSSWVEELRDDMPEHIRKNWQPHHYMIYMDSVGCFEVIAESWAQT